MTAGQHYLPEATTPLLVDMEQRTNITDLLVDRVSEAPEHAAFRLRRDDELINVTTREFHDLVTGTARGLIAQGVRLGDTLAIHGATGFAWAVADMAALWAGAVVVPIFDTSSAEQVSPIRDDAGVNWALADTE